MLEDVIEVGEVGSPIIFHWDIIDKCQFDCTYCYATEFNQNNFFEKKLYQNSYKLVLHKLKQLKQDFEIDLLGGEPTLHPSLLEILDELESMEHCKRISMYTNFSKPVSFFELLDIKGSKLTLCLSYHAEYHKGILRKYKLLHYAMNYVKVFVEVNLYPKREYFTQMKELISDLEESGIPHGVNTIRENEFWDGVIDEGFHEEFNQCLFDLNINSLAKPIKHVTSKGVVYYNENYLIQNNVSYKGYTCEALMYKIAIDGEITNMCSHKKIPMIINDHSFSPIKCPRESTCACPDMLHFRKVND